MIEMPRRSVTRFFVPLIDVLILLFCIFLLLPIYSQPGSADSPEDSKSRLIDPDKEPSLPESVRELQQQLVRARQQLTEANREVKTLQQLRSNLADRLSVLILEIDAKTGGLYYFANQERVDIRDQRTAEDVIDRHKRQAGNREPFFLILMPRELTTGFPSVKQLDDYTRWFKGEQFRFDNPLGPNLP